jgi:hypothetical protein
VHAAVDVVPPSREQPLGLERVQVMGERGLTDPDGRRQLALVGDLSRLEVEQDQPRRERAAGLRQRLVERTTDDPRNAGQLQADRWTGWAQATILPTI